MEPLPTWLHDAVAAAGIAGVYTDFDSESLNDKDEGAAPQASTH